MSPNLPCPRCGATTASDSAGPGGLCPACLLKSGLESRTGAPDVVFTDEGAPARTPPPPVDALAPLFPDLEILAPIGRGGTGVVYRAKQKSLGRDVALKILLSGGDAGFAERFQREARTLAGLSHPGIVSVIDYGQRGTWPFLLLEYVDGASLRQMLRARELGSREALSIVTQTCDALQYAHDHGVVHRDIKPENILVTRDGRVKVLDFGLAKLVGEGTRENLTREQQVMGTPHYMAPEQWEKPKTVDHRADIYALGVVFYELLTGELPIGRFAPPSQKVTLDVRLDDVVLRTLEKEPARRYQRAGEVKDAVTGIGSSPRVAPAAAGVPVGTFVAAAPPLPPSPATKPARSTAKVVAILGGVGCLVLVVAVFGTLFFVGTHRRIQAETAAQQAVERAIEAWSTALSTDALEAQKAQESLALSIDDETPAWSAVTAARLGVTPETHAAYDAAIEDVWRRYLALEAAHVSFQPEGVDGTRVHVRAFADERRGLLREARAVIERASTAGGAPSAWETTAYRHVARMMRFGDVDEIVHVRRPNGVLRATVERTLDGRSSPLGDGGVGSVVYPVPTPTGSWLPRLWKAGVGLSATPTLAPSASHPAVDPSAGVPRNVDASETALERRARELGLLESENGLGLSTRAAAELGIDETRLSKLNAAWRRAWSNYVAFENRQMTLGPRRPNRVDVIVREAPVARDDILRDAFAAIDAALQGNPAAADSVGVLRFHVDRLLRFGHENERLAITREGEDYVVEGLSADGQPIQGGAWTRSYRVPLPSWVLRAWMREFAFESNTPTPR